jgi:endonuclease III
LTEARLFIAARKQSRGEAEVPRVLRDPPAAFSDLEGLQIRDHREWREALVAGRYPAGRTKTLLLSGRQVDELASTLLTITTVLAERYGTPDLGNKPDPVDELVYILLSRRTREDAYQAAFDSLRSRYASWEELAAADVEEIENAVGFSGLGRRKAQSLKLALLALIDHFGSCTLEPTRSWRDEEVLHFVCSLPEIGQKSAACVMMCSLDRPAFPVDAHVGRVLERLGTLRSAGIELEGTDHKAKQRLLWDAIPPVLRYPLHVNALVHGRKICLPRRPRCGQCVVAAHCDFASRAGVAAEADSGRSTV